MTPAERAIHEVHTTWIAAVNARDLARLLTLMTDDAVFLNPGQAPFGPAKFSTNFSAAQTRVRIDCTSELEEVVVAGEHEVKLTDTLQAVDLEVDQLRVTRSAQEVVGGSLELIAGVEHAGDAPGALDHCIGSEL